MKIFAETVWQRVTAVNARTILVAGLMIVSIVSMILGGAADTHWE